MRLCKCGCGKIVPTEGAPARVWHPSCEEAKHADHDRRRRELGRSEYAAQVAGKKLWEPSDPAWWAQQHAEIRARHGR